MLLCRSTARSSCQEKTKLGAHGNSGHMYTNIYNAVINAISRCCNLTPRHLVYMRVYLNIRGGGGVGQGRLHVEPTRHLAAGLFSPSFSLSLSPRVCARDDQRPKRRGNPRRKLREDARPQKRASLFSKRRETTTTKKKKKTTTTTTTKRPVFP